MLDRDTMHHVQYTLRKRLTELTCSHGTIEDADMHVYF
jgi:hypothetical protein